MWGSRKALQQKLQEMTDRMAHIENVLGNLSDIEIRIDRLADACGYERTYRSSEVFVKKAKK